MWGELGIQAFQWVFMALFVAGIVDMAVLLWKRRRREKWIARQPVQRVHARVIALYEKERVVSGLRHMRRATGAVGHIRWTTGVFELQDGSTVELEMPKGRPVGLDEGLEIMLEYQGDRFLGYQRLTPRKKKKKHRRF